MFLAFLIQFQQANILFAVIFLLRLDNLASESVLVIKSTCANLALKTLATKVLNSGIILYFS